ncbi:hypothetical protein ACJJIF_02355 [Microbulbifer sp. SSSA002]|uniref:hypothetical protein n=1 Tax=Microbulbifer sp. SSSA002 TaxID=3243376 RepID=UPI00403A5036
MAGQDIFDQELDTVYKLDDETQFEFKVSGGNSCGGTWYRVKNPTESIESRKFSIVLTAYTTGKKIDFHDLEVCEGNRSTVGWVRFSF